MFDNSIPIPPSRPRKSRKHLFEGMQINDSKFIEFDAETETSFQNFRTTNLACAKSTLGKSVKLVSSKTTKDGKDGVRIWRAK